MSYEDLNNLLTPAPNVEITSAWGTQIRDNFEFIVRPPQCSTAASAAYTLGTATNHELEADTEYYDNDSMHSTSSQKSRITINTAGFYTFNAIVSFQADADGYRLGQLLKNGSVARTLFDATPNSVQTLTCSGGARLAAVVSDYFEVRVYHTAGNNLDVTLEEFSALWTGF